MATYLNTGAMNEQRPVQTLSADGAIEPVGGVVELVGAIAATLTPVQGQNYTFAASGAGSRTVTLGGSFTWNGSGTIATFDADAEVLTVVFNGTRAWVISNPASVAFT